jgi:hypothetical protein
MARTVVQERIDETDADDERLCQYIEALAALELILNAIEALERRPQQDSIKDEIRRLELAAYDMDAAADAAQGLIDQPRPGFHALEVGMVVCYARPFTKSYWLKLLGDEWLPVAEDDRKLHAKLICLRNKWAAHTDEESGRDVDDIGAMMGDTEPLFAATWRAGICPELFPVILRLCGSQRDRFREERRRLEAQLDEPPRSD